MPVILNRITLEEIRAARPKRIYYGINTCWWTHDPRHLHRHRASGLPCDPRGGMLCQTSGLSMKDGDLIQMTDEEAAELFLRAAEEKPEFYGRHGLRAFTAAHALNCVVSETDPRPTCLAEWEEYNALLDAAEGLK